MNIPQESKLRAIARKRAAFKRHLFIYGLVNTFLVLVNLLTTPDKPWAAGPLLGWGVGVLFHAYFTYWGAPDSLEDREFAKLKKQQGL